MVSQIIREGLNLFREREQPILEEPKRRSFAAIGWFSSGKPDVSDRHDGYLAEALGKEVARRE
jgi:hypothetical protein